MEKDKNEMHWSLHQCIFDLFRLFFHVLYDIFNPTVKQLAEVLQRVRRYTFALLDGVVCRPVESHLLQLV